MNTKRSVGAMTALASIIVASASINASSEAAASARPGSAVSSDSPATDPNPSNTTLSLLAQLCMLSGEELVDIPPGPVSSLPAYRADLMGGMCDR
eukprot:CAMPEP_0173187388 /NCGR_PEP_ID=MMETSP1141-20130122/10674_1 /TAXON_ID=483371 /ORGANISM="non described non described, Strain CCMP2298" /LENGTH=94 /DNA_ID=CAMNT_0014111205 /DNA_START=434 /DNA_END=718 /DNA_ORIENTATION=+